MSLIAKSLKRLQKSNVERKNAFLGDVKSFKFNEFFMYVLLIFFAVLLFVLYSFNLYENIDNELKKDFSEKVDRIAREIKKMEVQLAKSSVKKVKGLEYLLETGHLKRLKELAKEKDNIKYLGIYYVKTHKPRKGSKLLRFYLKKHEDNQAALYLALAYLEEGRYLDALNQLNKVKIDRFEVFLDRAVVYERLGDLEKAIENYRVAYEKAKDPVLRGIIRAKITILKFAK